MNQYHRKYKTIIEAAAKLTGSSAQTKKGAWKALTEKHLPKHRGQGFARKCGGYEKGTTRTAWKRQQWEARAERGAETIMNSLGLKSHWEGILSGGTDQWERDVARLRLEVRRGQYDELYAVPTLSYSWGQTVGLNLIEQHLNRPENHPLRLANRCIAAVESRGADEHGGWRRYAEFDKHRRGSVVSAAVYGTDETNDLHVVQVRQFTRQRKGGFPEVRKSYFLIGYNENGNPFAHPVPSQTVRAAIRKDSSSLDYVVQAAQAWIWGIPIEDLPTVLRNGDVAAIPVKRLPKPQQPADGKKIRERIIDSHWLYAKGIIRINESVYALNPTLRHFKGQHPTVKGCGWYRVVVGRRGSYHNFAQPTVD